MRCSLPPALCAEQSHLPQPLSMWTWSTQNHLGGALLDPHHLSASLLSWDAPNGTCYSWCDSTSDTWKGAMTSLNRLDMSRLQILSVLDSLRIWESTWVTVQPLCSQLFFQCVFQHFVKKKRSFSLSASRLGVPAFFSSSSLTSSLSLLEPLPNDINF